MRILFVIPYFYPAKSFGGPVKVAYEVGKELVKRGHEVVVYTSDAKDLTTRHSIESGEIEGMTVHYFKNSSMLLVKSSKLFITPDLSVKMNYELKSFDVVHAHEYTTYQNIIVHKLAKKYCVPYVLQAHGSLPKIGREARKWIYDFFFGSNLLKDASKVVALSQVEAKKYLDVRVPKEKIAIIPNGIDLSEYVALPPKGSFKHKYSLGENEKIVLYLGRIHQTKGIDLLLKAYERMIHALKCSNTKLVIAGPDDGYLAKVADMVSSLGLSNSVLFTGYIDDYDKISALADADVFVTPSFFGFPLTFLEACAVGTPIVTTTLGDTLDWIDGKVGFLTQPTEYEVAEAVCSIISDDYLRDQLSKKCKDTVRSMFSVEVIVKRLERVYESITNKH